MKAIVCELCGSNDLVKEDGLFVCQYCGTKYSLEEAKKLFVEISGPVTVKIEQPDIDESLLKARQALKSGMKKAAQKYIVDAFNNDPMNWQATVLMAFSNEGQSLDNIEKAFVILKSQSNNPGNEFFSLWIDIKDCEATCCWTNFKWDIWKAFMKVFPDQVSLLRKTRAIDAWKEDFERKCRPVNLIDENYPYFLEDYNLIKKYESSYYNQIFENYIEERNGRRKQVAENIQKKEEKRNKEKSFWNKIFG